MAIENTPTEGLTLDQAFQQLTANRNQTPEGQPEEEHDESVVDDDEGFEEEELDSDVTDEEDDSEADDDDDQEEADDEDESEGDADEEVFEVEVDGEVIDVTGDELVKGYLRHNDYTRKRQADAKRAKELEVTYQDKLSQLDQALSTNISAEEAQMKALADAYSKSTDDAQRQQMHYQYLQLQQSIQQRTTYANQVKQQRTLNDQAQLEAKLAEQQQVLSETFEDWDTRKEVLKDYLVGNGFQDLTVFVDAKMAELVDKAKRFDDLQLTRETVVKKKLKRKVPKTLKAGQGEKQFSVDKGKSKKLEQKFAGSRSLKDAFALLQARKN